MNFNFLNFLSILKIGNNYYAKGALQMQHLKCLNDKGYEHVFGTGITPK